MVPGNPVRPGAIQERERDDMTNSEWAIKWAIENLEKPEPYEFQCPFVIEVEIAEPRRHVDMAAGVVWCDLFSSEE